MTLDEFEEVWNSKPRKCVSGHMLEYDQIDSEYRSKREAALQEMVPKLIEIVKSSKAEAGRMACLGYPNPNHEKLLAEVFGE